MFSAASLRVRFVDGTAKSVLQPCDHEIRAGHDSRHTRSESWFWKKPYPSAILFTASLSTALIGTLIAVYGLGMEAIGWERAAFMWAYALAWFVFNDFVKMGTYKALRRWNLYG